MPNTLDDIEETLDILDDLELSDSDIEDDYDFKLKNAKVVETPIRDIRLRTGVTVENLLFAIGDDFGVTEEGYLYARESYIRNGIFQQLICKKLVVDENAVISGNLTVDKDLTIKGDLCVGGDITLSGSVKASGDIKCSKLKANRIDASDGYIDYLHAKDISYSGFLSKSGSSGNPIDLDNPGGGGSGGEGILDLDNL